MKYSHLLLGIAALATVISSCQKEADFPPGQNPGTGNPGTGNPGGSNDLVGEYDFISLSARTNVTITVTLGGDEMKTMTTSDYVTKNNVGTATITATQIMSNNMGYDIDTTMSVKIYDNGSLTDDFDLPFIASTPPSSNASPYVKNSADSITVTGAFGVAQGTSGAPPVGQTGLKYSWSGDTLILKVATSFVQDANQGGVLTHTEGSIVGYTRLKKK